MGLLTDVHGRGVFASRPAAGHAGRFYFATDTSVNYRDNGSSWDTQGTAGIVNPMTTAEDIIYGGASGTPTRKAKGSDGTFLGVAAGALGYAAVTDALLSTSDITTNNASTSKHGFAPKYPNDATKYLDGTGAYSVPPSGGGGGALVFLEAHTAAGSATLDFTAFISATYDYYLFEAIGIQAATNDVSFNANMGTGAGPTWDTTSGHYGWTAYGYTPAGAGATGSASTTAIQIRYHVPNSGNYRQSATFRLFLPASANPNLTGTSEGYDTANGAVSQNIFTGTYISTTAVTGVRFSMSSGNFDGTIRAYGITKS